MLKLCTLTLCYKLQVEKKVAKKTFRNRYFFFGFNPLPPSKTERFWPPLRLLSVMVYGEFFGEIVAEWKKESNLEGRFFWVQGKNLEGVKQQSEGGEGDVRCDLIFFPYTHQHESEAESQAKLFVLCFAIENKKIYRKKDRPSIFITHHAIFDVENCLFGIPYKEKCLKESTRETRGAGQRRMVTSKTNLSSKWKMFLENTTNKEELFSLLTKKVRDF